METAWPETESPLAPIFGTLSWLIIATWVMHHDSPQVVACIAWSASHVSDFELITITFSFILGLGIAQILSAVSSAVRNRRKHPLHWLPLAFAASIFLLHIQYWFVLFDFDLVTIESWNWLNYGAFLLVAVILFLSGGVVLPNSIAESEGSLIEDFEKNGKTSLLLVAVYLLIWVPFNAWGNHSWLHLSVWTNLIMVIPLLITYYARRTLTRNNAAMVFFAFEAYALLFVWSTPNNLV